MKTILITGGSGLIGSAIKLISDDYKNYSFIYSSSKECDLKNYENTYEYIKKTNPNFVIHLAANVGGLYKNLNNKVQMFEDNISINNNVLKACHANDIQRVICCLSTCIFPDNIEYPICEDKLHKGEPHHSNYPYAYAKRMLEVLCRAYNEQYFREYICVIPTNIYGPYDNFHLEDSHVIPGLIHKCYLARKNNTPFTILGSGSPKRQFIYSLDLAKLIMNCLFDYKEKDPIILSVSEKEEVSIKDVGMMISKHFNYQNIVFDTTFSDGQYKKTADNNKLLKTFSNIQFTPLDKGIEETIKWFVLNYSNARISNA
jgi:GDP-L-fucose synthase